MDTSATLVESTRFFLRHVKSEQSKCYQSGVSRPQLKAEEVGECFLMYQNFGVFPVFWATQPVKETNCFLHSPYKGRNS